MKKIKLGKSEEEKSESSGKPSKKTEKAKEGKSTGKDNSVDDEQKVKRSEQIKICIGVLLLVFALIMVISFVSYFFTWESDQSLSNVGFFKSLGSDIEVGNKAGKFGALLSNFFIRDTVGVASFAIVAMLVAISLRMLKIRKVKLLPFILKSSVMMIWFSIAFASIFRDHLFMLGGKHGYFLFTSLHDMIGGIGTYSVIIVAALIIVIFCFENSINGIKSFFAKLSEFKLKDIHEKLKEKDDEIKPQATSQEPPKDADVILPLTNADTESSDEISSEDKNAPIEDESKVIDFDDNPVEKPAHKEKQPQNLDFDINIGGESQQSVEQPADEIPEEEGPADIENHDGSEDEQHTEAEEKVAAEGVNLDVTIPEDEKTGDTEEWERMQPYDPTKDLEFYQFPSVDLLPEFHPKNQLSDEELKKQLNEHKDTIVQTLNNYNIAISKISATVGPTVTLYEIVPAPGIRISKIKNLEDDIALSLAALGIRIIAPIPGKGTIGIEVPNPNPETVSMNSVIRSQKFQDSTYDLPVALGKTISNETYVFNLAKTPHLLVAGATGQGKSVGINAIIASLLYKKHPSQLKFVLVDPKMVELSIYKAIEKHYLAKLPGDNPSIITDVSKVTEAMNSLCILMDERYELLTKAGCRNINEYNEKFIKRQLNPENGHYYMFYIVVVIDEFADIIVQEGRQVETPISRLAAKARAIGIHLIVATQRPSTNVITGVIKANFPSRIAFKVTNYIDSKTILDQTGANQLIGRGDLLISYNGAVTRVQCAFIDTPEVQKLVDHISSQQGYPIVYELPEVKSEGDEGGGSAASLDPNSRDELFDEAARLVCRTQQGSTSMLQRKFGIGYNRAGRIVDQLEAMGIVGPCEGSKARQVLYDEASLERYLESLHGLK